MFQVVLREDSRVLHNNGMRPEVGIRGALIGSDVVCEDDGRIEVLDVCRRVQSLIPVERLVIYCQTTSVSAAHAVRIVLLTIPRVGRSEELFTN